MRFYVATGLERAGVARALGEQLVEAGHEWTYDWTTHGAVAWAGPGRVREVALLEASGVARADVVVVLLPGARGTHVELGMAIALGKRVLVVVDDDETEAAFLGDRVCAFYLHPAVEIVRGFDALRERFEACPPSGPGTAANVYVPDTLTSAEIENPSNATASIDVHAAGGVVRVIPGGFTGFSRDAARSGQRWMRSAVQLDGRPR
jgi:hypothetical protein